MRFPWSPKPPPPAPIEEETRKDGWGNALTGLGILGKDKRLGSAFGAELIAQADAENIWRGDDMAARIIETVPNEMLREGFEVKIEEDKELSEEMDCLCRDMDLVENFRTALHYARAYGGAGILLGANDGSTDLARPLNEKTIRDFKWMNVLTPRELVPAKWYAVPQAPKYGEVELYWLVPYDAPIGAAPIGMPLIHESRIIRVPGVHTSRRAALHNVQVGWEDSVLVRCLQIITDFQHDWQAAGILVQDFAPAVLKIKGLARLLASTKPGEMTLAARAGAVETTRSIARIAIIDSEEEWKRESTNVTGLSDLLEKFCLRLAAAAGMPVSLLMGQAPAGLNATGDSDIRWFYDQVSSMQEQKLRPLLMRVLKLLFLAKEGPTGGVEPDHWDICFNPLWQLTEKEQAEVRYIQAQADALYITNQVVTPEEIAKSRFGGDGYSTDTVIDLELRDKLAQADHQSERLGVPTEEDQRMKEAAAATPATPPAFQKS